MVSEDCVRVVILDLHDAEIIADTRRAVPDAFRQRAATEQWVVSVTASQIIGRWDLGIRGPVGQHVLSFAASPNTRARVRVSPFVPSSGRPRFPAVARLDQR